MALALLATTSFVSLTGAAPAGAVVERDPGFTGAGAPVGFAQDNFGTLAEASAVASVPNNAGVVAAGYGQDNQGKFIAIGRYTTGGEPEALFGTPRKFGPTDGSGRPNSVANDVVVDADGYITVVGTIGDEAGERLVILRVSRTGQLDPTFGDLNAPGVTAGRKGYHIEPRASRSTGRAILRRSDGYVVGGATGCTIAGDDTHTCALLQRYDNQGVLQSTRALDAGYEAAGGIYALAGGLSTNIAAVGQVDSPTGTRTFGSSYVFDPAGTFISGTSRTTSDPDGDVVFRAVRVDTEARFTGEPRRGFIAVGTVGSKVLRKQFTETGAVASTLPGGGELRLPTPATGEGLAVTMQQAGRTIIGGVSAGKPLLARTARDGAGLDPSFFVAGGTGAPGTIVETTFSTYSAWRALSQPVLDASGSLSVYAAGTRTFAPLGASFLLARYVISMPPQAYLTAPTAGPGNVFGVDTEPAVDYISRQSSSGELLLLTEILWDGQLQYSIARKEESGTLRLPKTAGNHTVTIKTTDSEGLQTVRDLTYRKDDVDPTGDDDGDGLLNGWERTGDIDGDGKQDLDLPAMGADYRHKDLFVRMDWMKDHQINRTQLAVVTAAFRAAPVTNLDGVNGISLHIDHGSDAVMNGATNKTWGALSRAKELTHVDSLGTYVNSKDKNGKTVSSYDWTDFDKLDAANTTKLERKVFRYGVSVHKYAKQDSSGLARTNKDTFMVSMGNSGASCAKPATECSWGTAESQARTVMHEFGHTLGLRHGGTDDINFKPTYPSLMNYLWQLPGTPTATAGDGGFTYSNFSTAQINDLDETKLSEASGVTASGAAAGARSGFVCLDKKKKDVGVKAITFGKAVDWNCDGTTAKAGTTVSGDLTDDATKGVVPAPSTTDWAGIKFKGGAVGSPGDAPNPTQPKLMVMNEVKATFLQRLAQLTLKDSTKPKVTLRAAPGKLRANQPFTLQISASDKRGLNRLQVTVDGRPVPPPALPGSRTLKTAPRPKLTLTKGKHRIAVVAIDSAGNLASKSIEIQVR